jgi:hypothetical protein
VSSHALRQRSRPREATNSSNVTRVIGVPP